MFDVQEQTVRLLTSNELKKKSFLTDSNAAIGRLRNSEISRIEWHARKKTSMYSVYTNNIINVHVRDYISGKIGFAIER